MREEVNWKRSLRLVMVDQEEGREEEKEGEAFAEMSRESRNFPGAAHGPPKLVGNEALLTFPGRPHKPAPLSDKHFFFKLITCITSCLASRIPGLLTGIFAPFFFSSKIICLADSKELGIKTQTVSIATRRLSIHLIKIRPSGCP